MSYRHITLPENGQKLSIVDNRLVVPDNPILGFIEGDGIGPDITAAAMRVWDAAVEKAYGGKRRLAWFEILAGQKAFDAQAANAALDVWAEAAWDFGKLFPEGSETGHDTEAKSTIWSDRAGFDDKMAVFNTKVDEAIAANPDSVDALKGVAGPVFQSCKGCHDGYRVDKED